MGSNVRKCVVKCVLNDNIRLFGFPKEEHLKKIWIHNLNLPSSFSVNKRKVVCSRHFEKKWLGCKKLKKNAVPTLLTGCRPVYKQASVQTEINQDVHRELSINQNNISETHVFSKENTTLMRNNTKVNSGNTTCYRITQSNDITCSEANTANHIAESNSNSKHTCCLQKDCLSQLTTLIDVKIQKAIANGFKIATTEIIEEIRQLKKELLAEKHSYDLQESFQTILNEEISDISSNTEEKVDETQSSVETTDNSINVSLFKEYSNQSDQHEMRKRVVKSKKTNSVNKPNRIFQTRFKDAEFQLPRNYRQIMNDNSYAKITEKKILQDLVRETYLKYNNNCIICFYKFVINKDNSFLGYAYCKIPDCTTFSFIGTSKGYVTVNRTSKISHSEESQQLKGIKRRTAKNALKTTDLLRQPTKLPYRIIPLQLAD